MSMESQHAGRNCQRCLENFHGLNPSLTVVEFGAAIFGHGRFIHPWRSGLFLAKTYRLDLGVSNPQQAQCPAYRLCALLPERQVVLATTALIGVPFNRHLAGLVGREKPGMRLNDALEFGFDHVAVSYTHLTLPPNREV